MRPQSRRWVDPGRESVLRGLTAGIVLLAIASFALDLRPSVIPAHDARQHLNAFHLLYAGLVTEEAIPRWLPYGRYGNDSFLTLLYVTPTGYAVALLGSLIGNIGSIGLFKLVVLVEYLLMCVGTLLLAASLYRHLASVVLVGLGAVLSFSWLLSLDANFHYYYLLPIILLCLVSFLRTGRVSHAFYGAIACVVSAIGNVPYYPPLMAAVLGAFLVGYLVVDRPPKLLLDRGTYVSAGLLVVLVTVFVASYVRGFEDLVTYSSGRDARSLRIDLDVYLSYAGVTKIGNLAVAMVTGMHTHGDNTFYIGLAPLLLAGVAVVRARGASFAGLLTAGVFLVLFSFGGLVASIAYLLPGMSLYRHVGLVLGLARFLILLLAGFGLDSWLAREQLPRAAAARRVALLLALFTAEIGLSTITAADAWHYVLLPRSLVPGAAHWLLAASRVGLYALVIGAAVWIFPRWRGAPRLLPGAAALLAYGLDLASFRATQIAKWPEAGPRDVLLARQAYRPKALPFRISRTSGASEEASNPHLRFVATHGPFATTYVHAYEVAGVDPWIPLYRTDSLASGVAALLEARGVPFDIYPLESMMPARDEWLGRALGRDGPKLRLYSDSEVMRCRGPDCLPLVRGLPARSGALVLEVSSDSAPVRPVGALGNIAVTRFSHNGLDMMVELEGERDAWLYYADAYDDEWRAAVNGRQTAVHRANLAFKAVRVPPGRSSVTLRYSGGTGQVLLLWSSVGLVALAIAIVARRTFAGAPIMGSGTSGTPMRC